MLEFDINKSRVCSVAEGGITNVPGHVRGGGGRDNK
jgi:hypothetical protein